MHVKRASVYVGKRDILRRLTCRGKKPVFHLSPRDGHVIFVSGCLILTAVNSSSYGLLNITDRLVSIYARSTVIYDIGLHVAGVRAARRTQRHQIFLHQ